MIERELKEYERRRRKLLVFLLFMLKEEDQDVNEQQNKFEKLKYGLKK